MSKPIQILIALLLSLGSFQAHALIQNVGFANFSSYVPTTISTTTDPTTGASTTANVYNVFGGFPAVIGGCSGFPCNTCTTAMNPFSSDDPQAVCNTAALTPTTYLQITFSSTTLRGVFRIAKDDDTSTEIFTNPSSAIIEVGNSSTLSIQWGNICTAIGSDQNCAGVHSGMKLRIGVDAITDAVNYPFGDSKLVAGTDDFITVNFTTSDGSSVKPTVDPDCDTQHTNPGICKYEMFPGDNKGYLQSSQGTVNSGVSFPENGAVDFNAIRVYYMPLTTANCNDPGLGFEYDSPFETLSINAVAANSATSTVSGYSISNTKISGPVNETTYCARLAVVDQAGFVGGFTPFASATDTTNGTTTSTAQFKPSEVVGLLEKGNCFIATAAFGSPLDSHLNLFRAFRDQVLERFSLGQKFVRYYYANSMPLAVEVYNRPWLKHLVQAILWPVWVLLFITLEKTWIAVCLLLAGVSLYTWKRVKHAK